MKSNANVVPKITGTVLRRPVKIEKYQNWEYLWSKFSLADTLPVVKETSTIELLIGNDYYLDIILPEKFELQPGLYLLGSKLGWIITGRTSERSDENQEQSLLTLNFRTSTHSSFVVTVVDQSLPVKPPLEDFWNREKIGISEPCEKSDDMAAFQKFNKSVQYQNGRYFVSWPWKSE